jgi:hypothetical protein
VTAESAAGIGIDWALEEVKACGFEAPQAFFFATRGSPFWITC